MHLPARKSSRPCPHTQTHASPPRPPTLATRTPHALPALACARRNIDKAGGLDNYILNTPPKKLNSDVGDALFFQMQVGTPRCLRRAVLCCAAEGSHFQMQAVLPGCAVLCCWRGLT